MFQDSDALSRLMDLDPPVEFVGVLFFPRLGMTATGLHNDEAKTATWFVHAYD